MNEPTIAPMITDLAPATPTVAPLADAPAPVATQPVVEAVRGRVASPRTVFVRAMLEDTDGEITYSTALPILEAAGFTVDQNTFNVTKSAWKRAKRPDAPKDNTAPKTLKVHKPVKVIKVKAKGKLKRELPEVTTAEAIAFVQDAGGLAKAEANVLRGRAALKAFKQLVKQTSKLAA